MGEKIKDLGCINLLNKDFVIELNKATQHNGSRYIHLQNSNFRLQMKEKEFVKFVCMANKAKFNLEHMKNIGDKNE